MINCLPHQVPPLSGVLSITRNLNQLLTELHQITNFRSITITLEGFELSVQSLNTPLRFGETGPSQAGTQTTSGSSVKQTFGSNQYP